MNTLDVMRHGHRTVLQSVEGLETKRWDEPRVVGVWSTKQVIAHLASFEAMLVDVLAAIQEDAADTPVLDEFLAGPAPFNDAQVARRDHLAPGAVLSEYETNFDEALDLARGLPGHAFTRNGLLDWYGADYDLDDFIAYMYYGHKREHSAQIKLFRSTLERG
jgi:hypothetical protein